MIKEYGQIKHKINFKTISTEKIDPKYQEEIEEFSKKLTFDDYQLKLVESLSHQLKYKTLLVSKIRYSELSILRQHDLKQEILTANVLPFIIKEGQKFYLLQVRTSNIETNLYSFFGGGIDSTDSSVYEGCIRELTEELIGIKSSKESMIKDLKDCYCDLTQDLYKRVCGNVQFNFFDLPIEVEEDFHANEEEGKLFMIEDNKLEEFLKSNPDKFTEFSHKSLINFFDNTFEL